MKNDNKENGDLFIKEFSIIFKKYKPLLLIGKGSFGKVYLGININTKEKCAIKVFHENDKNLLKNEVFNIMSLKGFGFPKLLSCGRIKNHNLLIENLLGKSLEKIFIENNKKFTLTDICLIAIQVIERIKWIHSKNFVYKDIKPSNFLIGLDDPENIYVVDFGTCSIYCSSRTGKHILPIKTKKFSGTLNFASPNILEGKQYSRRDDMISIGYMLIYLFKGELPWDDTLTNINENKYLNIIKQRKISNLNNLFTDLPEEMTLYLSNVLNLQFQETPDYDYLTSLFQKLLNKINKNKKNIEFSWISNKQIQRFRAKSKKNSVNSKYRRLREKLMNSISPSLNNIELQSISDLNTEVKSTKNIKTEQSSSQSFKKPNIQKKNEILILEKKNKIAKIMPKKIPKILQNCINKRNDTSSDTITSGKFLDFNDITHKKNKSDLYYSNCKNPANEEKRLRNPIKKYREKQKSIKINTLRINNINNYLNNNYYKIENKNTQQNQISNLTKYRNLVYVPRYSENFFNNNFTANYVNKTNFLRQNTNN